jgi:chromosome segregation ATPase
MDNTTPTTNTKMNCLKRKQTHDETSHLDFNPPRPAEYASMHSPSTEQTHQEAFSQDPTSLPGLNQTMRQTRQMMPPAFQPIRTETPHLAQHASTQFNDTQKTIAALQEGLQRETDSADHLEAEVLDLKREKREEQSRAEVAEIRVDTLEEKVEELRREHQLEMSNLKLQATKQAQKLERRLRLADHQTRGLKLQVSQQAQQVASQQTQLSQELMLEAQTDAFTSQEFDRLRTRDEKHVEYEQSLAGALDTAKELINHLTNSVEEKSDLIKRTQAAKDELIDEKWSLLQEKTVFEMQVHEMQQKLEIANQSFNDYHADCEHEFQLAEEAKKDQHEVINHLADEKKLLEAQVQEVRAKNNELENENGALRLEVERLSNVAEEFDQAQDAAHAEKDCLKEELQRKADVVKGALAQVESSKATLQQEMKRNEASEQELRDTIYGLNKEKSELDAHVGMLGDSAGRAWDIVRDKQQLRRNETKDWQDDFDRQDEYVKELEKKVEKLEKEATESTEKIDKLMDEKIDVFNVWREEVKDLKDKIQEGEEANTTSREQIGMLEEEIQEMIAERVVSSDDEDENDDTSDSASNSTLRESSPVYDIPGWTPSSIPDCIKNDQHDWGQSEFELVDGLPKATRKRSRREEDEMEEFWVGKTERQSRPEIKRRRVEHETEM